jgi:hypothetical protein
VENKVIDVHHENLIPLLDVRKIIPVSVPTLRRWTASGQLETVKAGRKRFTTQEAVARLLEHNGTAPVSGPTRSATLDHQSQAATARLATRFARFS